MRRPRVSAIGTLLVVGLVTAAHAESAPRVLRLDEAVRVAQERQPSVLAARAQTEAAAGRVEQARSGYLPQVTASAVYQRIHGSAVSRAAATGTAPVTTGGAGLGNAATYNLFSAGVSATQLIWDFGQTIDKTRSATVSREAQQSAERTTLQQATLNVRRAFFQAHAQKALVQVGKEAIGNQERHLAQIQGFVEQGIRPEIDLAQARTDLANSRVTLINAETAYRTARAQLNQAMGVAGPVDFDVSDEELPAVAGEELPSPRLVELAMQSRPELRTLERQHRAAELTLSSIHGAYGPTLGAFGGVSEAGLALDALGTNWNVGVNLTWPLFQGGLTAGQSREARANIDVAGAALAQERLAIAVEVEQARLGIEAAKVVILAADDAVTNARERFRLAEGRYESGVGSIIELDDAQLALLNTGAQRVQAAYDLSVARAELLSALGR